MKLKNKTKAIFKICEKIMINVFEKREWIVECAGESWKTFLAEGKR